MSTSTDFKILEIPVDGVNSYIPPIIINEADNNGRHLKFTPTYEGQPVTGFTSARLYYDPRPKDAYSVGGYIDGTQDGDGWTFVIPANTFTADMQGNGSVSFTDSDGETYTRNIQFLVESGGTKALSQGSKIDQLVALLQSMVTDFTMTAEAETGAAGSQANVTVTLLPSGAYNLNFTIPQGIKGDKGDPGDLTKVNHNSTLLGDGTTSSPLGIALGSIVNQGFIQRNSDLDDIITPGSWALNNFTDFQYVNVPNDEFSTKTRTGNLFVLRMHENIDILGQVLFTRLSDTRESYIYMRVSYNPYTSGWGEWIRLANNSDLSKYALLSSYQVVETKVEALEAKTNLVTLESTTDLYSLLGTNGIYLKQWGITVTNGPTSKYNSKESKYIVKVISDDNDSFMEILPITGVNEKFYIKKGSSSGISNWYKIQTEEVKNV